MEKDSRLAKEQLFKAQTKEKRHYDEGTRAIKYNIGELAIRTAKSTTNSRKTQKYMERTVPKDKKSLRHNI